jgi:demethylmenaquinone methyltransferase / 2-methoxy-6-polyprenyl-1,4-benzoquinol methylase
VHGSSTMSASAETHFGFSTVPLTEKQTLVDDVFHKVAGRYDIMNDVMSGGLHRLWKDNLVNLLNPPRQRAFRHLDVAGGTSDVAIRIVKAGGPDTHCLRHPQRAADRQGPE